MRLERQKFALQQTLQRDLDADFHFAYDFYTNIYALRRSKTINSSKSGQGKRIETWI